MSLGTKARQLFPQTSPIHFSLSEGVTATVQWAESSHCHLSGQWPGQPPWLASHGFVSRAEGREYKGIGGGMRTWLHPWDGT